MRSVVPRDAVADEDVETAVRVVQDEIGGEAVETNRAAVEEICGLNATPWLGPPTVAR
jgi:hypothetical protein